MQRCLRRQTQRDVRELATVLRALLRSSRRPSLAPPGPFALSYPESLEALLERSGLSATDDGYIDYAWELADEATLLRASRSGGPAVLAGGPLRDGRHRDAERGVRRLREVVRRLPDRGRVEVRDRHRLKR
jgi:hypothetical protein